MSTFNAFLALGERIMTTKEKEKEDRLKDKYDDSSMKKNMKDHYGKKEGEKVYYATIRKQAMKNEHHQKDADGNEIPHEATGTPASVEEAAQPAGQVPDKRAEALKKRQSMIKKQVLMKKLQALRQGGGEDVVAHNELEGDMVEGIGDAVKKGVKRHKDAVQKKKIKNRKAVPYAALAAETQPEGELVEGDVHSGQGEKIQKRTLAWMKKKGRKGAPGLDAMKEREAEHKAKRGVKEEVVDEAKASIRNKRSFGDLSFWRNELLGEEDYDKMKDARLVKYGIGHDGSDRKGPTSPPPKSKVKGKTVLQKETEKKYGKGVSALDVVTAKIRDKYGKDAIMKPKK